VTGYHEVRLAELVEPVGRAIDSFHAGELDAFAADRASTNTRVPQRNSESSTTWPMSWGPRRPSMTCPIDWWKKELSTALIQMRAEFSLCARPYRWVRRTVWCARLAPVDRRCVCASNRFSPWLWPRPQQSRPCCKES